MTHRLTRCTLGLLLALVGAAPAMRPPAAGAAVLERAVTFKVENVNRSALPCASDGSTYTLKGKLVGPASAVGPENERARAVTLYQHGFTIGASLWSFDAVPRYDHAAAMARAGHVSVVVDRLAYGASGRPGGDQTCLGAHADVAHQVIEKLRGGDYTAEGGKAPRFDRVALAGHSIGGLIANLEVFSFGDADGLVVMSHTPQVTRRTFEQFYANRVACEAGGEPASPAGPAGYAYFGGPAEFRPSLFHSADPAVLEAAERLRGRDPCGDTASIIDALVTELRLLPRVSVPVLLVCGREDAVTPDFACPFFKRRYTGSRDVSLAFIRDAGHALPLERRAPRFRRRLAAWLADHRF